MKIVALVLATGALIYAAELKLGKPLSKSETLPVETLLSKPASYLGNTVQVKGTITEVCQMMGCWMNLESGGKSIRIKVEDGQLEFPKDAAGRTAIAEGKLTKLELTRQQALAQAKHEAEEMHHKFDPAKVKGPATMYQIEGVGAVILN